MYVRQCVISERRILLDRGIAFELLRAPPGDSSPGHDVGKRLWSARLARVPADGAIPPASLPLPLPATGEENNTPDPLVAIRVRVDDDEGAALYEAGLSSVSREVGEETGRAALQRGSCHALAWLHLRFFRPTRAHHLPHRGAHCSWQGIQARVRDWFGGLRRRKATARRPRGRSAPETPPRCVRDPPYRAQGALAEAISDRSGLEPHARA